MATALTVHFPLAAPPFPADDALPADSQAAPATDFLFFGGGRGDKIYNFS